MTQTAGWDLIHQRLLGSRWPEERGLLLEMAASSEQVGASFSEAAISAPASRAAHVIRLKPASGEVGWVSWRCCAACLAAQPLHSTRRGRGALCCNAVGWLLAAFKCGGV